MSQKKIKIALPLILMKKGDVMYIYRDSWEIRTKGESIDELKLFLYIKKDAILAPYSLEDYLLIKKVGDGLKSGDFEINFPENSFYYPVSNQPLADEDSYLEPSEINFELVNSTNVDKLIDYHSFSLNALNDALDNCLDKVNIDFEKPQIEKILKALPAIAEKEFVFFDEGMLNSTESFWQEALGSDQRIKEKKRREFAVAFDKKVLEVIEKVRKQNQSKVEIQQLSIEELEIRLEKASNQGDFELAAQIRDLILEKQKQESN